MTFEELLTVDDPATLQKLTDKELDNILKDSLTNCPPVEETWIHAKLLAKSLTPKKKKSKALDKSTKTLALLDKLKGIPLKDIIAAQKKIEG